MKTKTKKRGGEIATTIAMFALCLALTLGMFFAIPNEADIKASADPENLLQEAVVITENTENYQTFETLEYSIGLITGTTYTINYDYAGQNYSTTYTAISGSSAEGIGVANAIELGGMSETTTINVPEGETNQTAYATLLIADKAYKSGTDEDGNPVFSDDANKTMIFIGANSDEDNAPAITINSIVVGTTPLIIETAEESINATDIVNGITGSFTGVLGGLGEGIVNLFEIAFVNEEGGLTTFAIIAIAMMGLGIATGLLTWIKSVF